MASAKNALIDALARLVNTQNPEARWKAATDLSTELGLGSILVAQLDFRTQDIHWVNTNLSDAWMEEYLAEDYLSVDPLVPDLANGSKSNRVEFGTLHRMDAPNQKAWSLNHGLQSEGFGHMICSRFGDSRFGQTVTLGFTPDLHENDLPFDHHLFAALLASTIGAPVDSAANMRLGVEATSPLTQRQREVLSLLAEGNQTARIAEKLGLSEPAVSQHFANARKALGAQTREHALAIALRDGLIAF